uniref:Uncharacterized protein n=1 Tax=Pseudomonas aeruginosa TaxID=287 RepID=A0A6C0L5R2_PSEAI|nr:hypothetical protein [Pseudomonas aeruginosa]
MQEPQNDTVMNFGPNLFGGQGASRPTLPLMMPMLRMMPWKIRRVSLNR